jgi:hypothetical protein
VSADAWVIERIMFVGERKCINAETNKTTKEEHVTEKEVNRVVR